MSKFNKKNMYAKILYLVISMGNYRFGAFYEQLGSKKIIAMTWKPLCSLGKDFLGFRKVVHSNQNSVSLAQYKFELGPVFSKDKER